MGHSRLIRHVLLALVASTSLAGCLSRWGPLAIYGSVPVAGGGGASGAGTLVIIDQCSYLDRTSDRVQLAWPEARTKWDFFERAITLTNDDGTAVTVRDGDNIHVSGYLADGAFRPPGQIGDFSKGSWQIEPDPACADRTWAVYELSRTEQTPT